MLVKMKVVYTLVEQYTGAQRIVVAILHTNQAPSLLRDVLNKLFVLLARVEEIKRSSARTTLLLP